MPILTILIFFAAGYRIDAGEGSLPMMPYHVVRPPLDPSQDFFTCYPRRHLSMSADDRPASLDSGQFRGTYTSSIARCPDFQQLRAKRDLMDINNST